MRIFARYLTLDLKREQRSTPVIIDLYKLTSRENKMKRLGI